MNTTANEKEWVCQACGEVFDSKEELERHVREIGLVY